MIVLNNIIEIEIAAKNQYSLFIMKKYEFVPKF